MSGSPTTRVAFIGLVFAATAWALVAQQRSARDESEAALHHFLEADCELPESGGVALAEVLRHAGVLEPRLIRILRQGPDATEMADLEGRIREEWMQLQDALRLGARTGLRPADLRRLAQLSAEDHAQGMRRRHALQHREKAAVALAAIGSAAALQALDEARNGSDGDLRSVIDQARRRFRR